MALKRLIKRNMKREGQINQIVDRLGLGDGSCRQKTKARGGVCKMPFVVANYSPEDSGTESKGLERKERFIKVNSKTPIQTYVD